MNARPGWSTKQVLNMKKPCFQKLARKGGREGGRRETDRAKRILNRKPALARE